MNAERLAGLRVVILVEWLELGGAERQAVMLARELRQQHAVDVHIWALGRDNGQGEQRMVTSLCEQYGVPIHESPVKIPDDWMQWPVGLAAFAEILKQAQPDVLMPYWNKPNITAGIIWRWTGARTCIWGQRDEGIARPPRWLEAIAVANTPWFIPNSEIGAEYLTQTLGIPTLRVRKVCNGIDPPVAQASRLEWRASLDIPANAFAVTMVAHLHGYKDHSTLLESWKIFMEYLSDAAQRSVPAYLVLAGNFYALAATLQEQAKNLGITESVRFTGRVADITGLINAMDVCVHSSLKEGLPNAILEAMHAGLPVVGTDIPGIREALGNQSDHFLVPPQDPITLANKLNNLYQMDPITRRSIGMKNQQRISDTFSPDRMATEIMSVFDSALAQSAPYSRFGVLLQIHGVLHLLLFIARITKVPRSIIKKSISNAPFIWRFTRYL